MHKLHGSSSGTLSRINLADSIGLTGSGVTRLLSPMIKNNIILKIVNSKNARQSLVSLTSTGKELYKDALNSFEDSCNSIYSSLEESEVEQLLSLLNKIKC
jgi:DNA-binding MarR family transcriptional regulator